jgi:hypothetical protein
MDRTVSIRLSEEEYEALCRLARAQVRKVSGQARWLIRTALESAGEVEAGRERDLADRDKNNGG